MSKHTPGPWSFTLEYDEFNPDDVGQMFSVTDANGDGVVGGDGFYDSPWCNLADARLIAAAPDLLEALQELLYARTDKAERMGKEAIAKATGENV